MKEVIINTMSATTINWKKQDWKNKTDAALARETGFSRPTIAAKRKLYGSPRKSKWDKVDWANQRNADIAAKLEISPGAVSIYRRAHGKPECGKRYQRTNESRKYPRHLFNWLLPNADLQEIWDLPDNYAANLRQTSDVPDAKWDKRVRADRANAEYRHAVGREKAKATRWATKK
jgi:hypothetical protein